MKNGFKNPLEVKNQKPKNKPVEGKNSPWDFHCPEYDERSSCYVNAGTYYGVGHNQPVGTHSPSNVSAVPYGKIDTKNVDVRGY